MSQHKITRQQAADMYALLLHERRMTGDELVLFIITLNGLLRDHWSEAGLRWIKERAWKSVDTAIPQEGRDG